MPEATEQPLDSADVATILAEALDHRRCEYAIGGAIALGFWSEPRGTMDVDLTLFLPQDKPRQVVQQLCDIGCDVDESSAIETLNEHGFCRASYRGLRVDVFVEAFEFYQTAKRRRVRVSLRNREVMILDAETLCVFKMMFFREKDFLDIKGMMRDRGPSLDRGFVREQLIGICGSRDPRIVRWDEIVAENPA